MTFLVALLFLVRLQVATPGCLQKGFSLRLLEPQKHIVIHISHQKFGPRAFMAGRVGHPVFNKHHCAISTALISRKILSPGCFSLTAPNIEVHCMQT